MTTNINRHAIDNVIQAMNDDSLIIFVGAGVSVNSGFPSWNGLINEFKNELSLTDEDNLDNVKIAQIYYDTWGKHKYYEKLVNIFEKQNNALPNELHQHIFKIQPSHLITTNYDTLLEDKMNEGINKYSVVKKEEDIPYSNSERYLIKMHGDLNTKNIVLKENDYLDYQMNFYMTSTLIKSLILNHTILFVGYSLNDTTFNSIFRMIHNYFGEDTKKAYFFTAEKPKIPIMEYYTKKGINVLFSSENNDMKKGIGERTAEFLSEISEFKSEKATDYKSLWKGMKSLNYFAFIESRDVVNAITLKNRPVLFSPDVVKYNSSKSKRFNLPLDCELSIFLKSKTRINMFIENKIEHSNEPIKNKILEPGFDLYKKRKYSEAKVKFREIANEAYLNNDYLNFLIAEFNVEHIPMIPYMENVPVLPKTPYEEELSDVIEKLAMSTKLDVKKAIIYFRDIIFSLKFLYRKIYKINSIFDKLRIEHNSYKRGGFSANDYLYNLREEVISINQFIQSNCLCVQHYKDYQLIANRYFESLLIAVANSEMPRSSDDFFGGTSTIINEIDIEDVKMIVPFIDKKLVSVYLDNYKLSKIGLTNDAVDYVIEEAIILSEHNRTRNDLDYQLLQRYINFLSFVNIKNNKKMITLFESYPVFDVNRRELSYVLNIMMENVNLKKEFNEKIMNIVSNHLEKIIKNKYQLQYSNFPVYAKLLSKANAKVNKKLCILTFSERLESIYHVPGKLKEIEAYEDLIAYFYKYLNEKDKQLIDNILGKYAKLSQNNVNINFIISLTLNEYIPFEPFKYIILQHFKSDISKEVKGNVKVFPDPLERNITLLLQLYYKNIITKEDILNMKIDDNIKGKNAFIDWLIFDVREDRIIEEIIKYNSFLICKKILDINKGDIDFLNNWAIRQFEENSVELKSTTKF